MDDRFVVRIGARGYEVDANGHVAASVCCNTPSMLAGNAQSRRHRPGQPPRAGHRAGEPGADFHLGDLAATGRTTWCGWLTPRRW
jgi:hypothetical protein